MQSDPRQPDEQPAENFRHDQQQATGQHSDPSAVNEAAANSAEIPAAANADARIADVADKTADGAGD